MSKLKFKLVDYFDVWKNDEDGYDVNNLCVINAIKIEVDEDNYLKEIVDTLKEQRYLKDTVDFDDFEIYDNFEMIEFFDKKTDEPLFRVELEILY